MICHDSSSSIFSQKRLNIHHLFEDHFKTLETNLNSNCRKEVHLPDLSSRNMPNSKHEGPKSLQLTRQGTVTVVQAGKGGGGKGGVAPVSKLHSFLY